MSQRLVLRPEAESDIAEAPEWYDQQSAGLSLQFRAALDKVRRFPFGIFYIFPN